MKKTAVFVDDLIVGSGATGLLIAAHLKKRGRKVLVLEQREEIGGQFKPAFSAQGTELATGFGILPSNSPVELWTRWLSSLALSLPTLEVELAIKTFGQGDFKTFSGFGTDGFQSIDALSRLNSSNWLGLKGHFSQLISKINKEFQLDIQKLHPVTRIQMRENQGYIASTDRDQHFECENLFFTGSPKDFPELLAPEFKIKGLHRFGKIDGFAQLSLQLSHSQHSSQSDKEIYFLYGSSTQFEPVVGRFFSDSWDFEARSETERRPHCWTSYWIQLIPWEQSLDTEFVGQSVKYMKKQIKRAFPELDQNLLFEKITLSPSGSIIWPPKTLESVQWPKGLHLATHLQSSYFGEASYLDIAYQATHTNQADISAQDVTEDSDLAPIEAPC